MIRRAVAADVQNVRDFTSRVFAARRDIYGPGEYTGAESEIARGLVYLFEQQGNLEGVIVGYEWPREPGTFWITLFITAPSLRAPFATVVEALRAYLAVNRPEIVRLAGQVPKGSAFHRYARAHPEYGDGGARDDVLDGTDVMLRRAVAGGTG